MEQKKTGIYRFLDLEYIQEVRAVEWTQYLRGAIKYMEDHLLDDISAEDVANSVYMSPFYLQKGFKIMTGYSLSEYIRCRRLYMAALDIISGRGKVIDVAYRYGYETPESFTKAFGRFHGVTPMQMKNEPYNIKPFLPLKINIVIQGGNDMDYVVEKMNGFKLIGFEREFSFETAYQEIPRFWDEIKEKYFSRLWNGEKPKDEIDKMVCNCIVGEFGVSIDDIGKDGKFRYLVAGMYTQGEVPQGMTVFEFPDTDWVKFKCTGPTPEALQSVNTKVFKEWLPNNPDYKIALGANVEWYSKGDTRSADYESEIWLPVEKLK